MGGGKGRPSVASEAEPGRNTVAKHGTELFEVTASDELRGASDYYYGGDCAGPCSTQSASVKCHSAYCVKVHFESQREADLFVQLSGQCTPPGPTCSAIPEPDCAATTWPYVCGNTNIANTGWNCLSPTAWKTYKDADGGVSATTILDCTNLAANYR